MIWPSWALSTDSIPINLVQDSVLLDKQYVQHYFILFRGADCFIKYMFAILPLFSLSQTFWKVYLTVPADNFQACQNSYVQLQCLSDTTFITLYVLIASPYSVTGYLIYFIFTLFATCWGWRCWSHGCGFILMGMPSQCFSDFFLVMLYKLMLTYAFENTSTI